MELRFHAKARSDFDEIWTYVAYERGMAVADRLLDGIYDALVRVVLQQPGSGRKRPEFGDGIRSYPIVPYVAFYQASRNRVTILRIIHGRRDIKRPLMSLIVTAS
jgi:toxin ParE1/3/4